MSKLQPSRVLKLYKDLLRYGEELNLTDKKYFKQRIRDEFRKNKNLQDDNEIIFCFEVHNALH